MCFLSLSLPLSLSLSPSLLFSHWAGISWTSVLGKHSSSTSTAPAPWRTRRDVGMEIGGREGGREGRSWQWISLSPLSALSLSHVSQICPCSSFGVSRVFCPCSRSSPALLLLLNRWPVGSLTLINLTSIRPEVIGMPRRWLQGSGAAYESPRPLMNDSHHAWNMCECQKGWW